MGQDHDRPPARAQTHTHTNKHMAPNPSRQLKIASIGTRQCRGRRDVLGSCMARLQNLKSMHAQERCKQKL